MLWKLDEAEQMQMQIADVKQPGAVATSEVFSVARKPIEQSGPGKGRFHRAGFTNRLTRL